MATISPTKSRVPPFQLPQRSASPKGSHPPPLQLPKKVDEKLEKAAEESDSDSWNSSEEGPKKKQT